MPYIITVNQPGCLPEQDPYAVATIEEARGTASDEVTRSCGTQHDDYVLQGDAHSVPESGGTVGPLPDGYVIEVRKVTWGVLADYAGESVGHDVADDGVQAILDAYNAQ